MILNGIRLSHVNLLARLSTNSSFSLEDRVTFAELSLKAHAALLGLSDRLVAKNQRIVAAALTYEEKIDMSQGRKIAAIKSYRNRTGVSLLEAKNTVEAWYAANPNW